MSKIKLSETFIKDRVKLALTEDLYPYGDITSNLLNNNKIIDLQNPSSLPEPTQIKFIEEPWIKATIITPDEYLGAIIKLCQDKRGIQINLTYSGNRAVLSYELPLNEVVFDFNDRIKSMTSGYASFDYEIIEHREGDLVKLGILVNAEPVDALAMMIHKDFAQRTGREVCEKLKDLIPRHNFMIPVQAAIGGKIIARETIKGFKKDVLTKIHGGGATDRKRKLLEKQKKGKARSTIWASRNSSGGIYWCSQDLKRKIIGEVAEWLKAHAWKACKGAILSWVRIPFSPPLNMPLFAVLISPFLLN